MLTTAQKDPGRSTDVDLSAPLQRIAKLGVCQHGLWAVGECENNASPPSRFLCLLHPAGVQVTLGQFSGGSFRRRGDTIEDTIFFRDGSTKPSQKGTMKNASASAISNLGRVAKESPEQVRPLQPDVTYEYGDHWVLKLVDEILEVTNKHAELMLKTTFDGRPVTTATSRYHSDSRSTIRFMKSSEVSFVDAWGATRSVFDNPSEFSRMARARVLTLDSRRAHLPSLINLC